MIMKLGSMRSSMWRAAIANSKTTIAQKTVKRVFSLSFDQIARMSPTMPASSARAGQKVPDCRARVVRLGSSSPGRVLSQ